ncbi:MAG: hypothetical protein IPH77_15180 [Ignavibacteria bacterium]|nr:hypothetical protein [Ignavibacteria bacterium]
MKTLFIVITMILCVGFTSCEKTTKETSKSADTMVIKKDTAIKRADTTGFDKK